MNKLFLSALAVGAVSLSAVSANAAILSPGTGVLGAGGIVPFPTGTLVDTLTSPAVLAGVNATLKTDVYGPDANNPSGLTFVYTLSNAANSDFLERFNTRGYSGFTVDVGYAATSFVPSAATLSSVAQDNGDLLGFNFQDGFGSPTLPNGGVAILIVRTNAKGDTTGIANVIDNAAVATVSLVPTSGTGRTPEPASLSLLGVGGVMLLRRRKNV